MSAGFYNPLIVCGFIFYICYTLVDISTSKNPDQTQDRDRHKISHFSAGRFSELQNLTDLLTVE